MRILMLLAALFSAHILIAHADDMPPARSQANSNPAGFRAALRMPSVVVQDPA